MKWTPPAVPHHCARVNRPHCRQRRGGIHIEHTTVAVDLAKPVVQIALSRRPGQVDEEHRLSRELARHAYLGSYEDATRYY